MFDEKFMYEYKSVKAPKELKSRILNRINSDEVKKNYRITYRLPYYVVLSVVCVLIIFCGYESIKYINSTPHISIINDYDVKAKNVISTCNVDIVQVIPIEIETDYEMTVSVNTGSIYVFSDDGEEVICDSYKGRGKIVIQWVIDNSQIDSSQMSITSFIKKYTYALYEINGEIRIKKCKNN